MCENVLMDDSRTRIQWVYGCDAIRRPSDAVLFSGLRVGMSRPTDSVYGHRPLICYLLGIKL